MDSRMVDSEADNLVHTTARVSKGSELVPRPRQSSAKDWIAIGLVLVALSIISGGGYRMWRSNSNQPSNQAQTSLSATPSATPTLTTTSSTTPIPTPVFDPYANWMRLSDSNDPHAIGHQFDFKYPPTWEINPTG